MKMKDHNAKNSNEKKSFIGIIITFLSHLGNLMIIALGVIYFGIKKIFLALKRRKDHQTLDQFVKTLEGHLYASCENFETRRKKDAYTRSRSGNYNNKTAGNNIGLTKRQVIKSNSITPAVKQHIKNISVSIKKQPVKNFIDSLNNKKHAHKNSGIINILQVAAVIAAAGTIVFIIIISTKGLFVRKDALAGQNDLQDNTTTALEEINELDVLEEPLNPYETLNNFVIEKQITAIKEKMNLTVSSLSQNDEVQSEECLDEPLEETPESTPAPGTEEPVENTPEPTDHLALNAETMIHLDDTNDLVAEIQERLMDLHYMDSDEPTTFYGPVTEYAIQLFQRGQCLSVDGVAGYETLTLLFSDEAKPYLVRKGDKGTDIAKIQERLAELGYLDDKDRDGRFDEDTDYAARMFQGRNKLSQDGIIGHNTTQVLFNEDAKPAKNSSSGSDSSSGSSSGGSSSGGSSDGGSYNANDAASFVAFAKSLMGQGIPYVWGGKTTSGLDCSGFVYYCLNQTGNSVGYKTSSAWAQSSYATISSIHDVKAGDILCFDGHVGICIGDGKMIDSSSSQNGIRITSFESSTYWNNKWVCGKRVFS